MSWSFLTILAISEVANLCEFLRVSHARLVRSVRDIIVPRERLGSIQSCRVSTLSRGSMTSRINRTE